MIVLLAAAIGAWSWRIGMDAREQPADAGSPVAATPAAPATAPEPAVPGTIVEVAPPIEAAVPVLLKPRTSFGRRAGLHKSRDNLKLTASAALVVNHDTGEVLFAKNGEAILPIASLTKLMTAIVVTEAMMPWDEVITITQDDIDTERHSRSRLRVGTTLTRREALHLALMSSENRAAQAMARTFPGGLGNFVRAMNRKAKVLGMQNTLFVDPTGLSERNQSTAHDLAILADAAAKNPLLAEYSTTPQRQLALAPGRSLLYNNSNRLVKNPQWDISLQKTGYIIEAGWCVVMHTTIDGQNLVVVLLDASGKGTRSADAERIKRWVASLPDEASNKAGGQRRTSRS